MVPHNSIYSNNSRKKVGGILLNQTYDKILLIQGVKSGKWGVPKGSMEHGETVREAAIREVKEETGISIGIDKYTVPVKIGKMYLYTTIIDDSQPLHPCDTGEIKDIKWFAISDLSEMGPNTVTVPFRKVINFLTNYMKKRKEENSKRTYQ